MSRHPQRLISTLQHQQDNNTQELPHDKKEVTVCNIHFTISREVKYPQMSFSDEVDLIIQYTINQHTERSIKSVLPFQHKDPAAVPLSRLNFLTRLFFMVKEILRKPACMHSATSRGGESERGKGRGKSRACSLGRRLPSLVLPSFLHSTWSASYNTLLLPSVGQTLLFPQSGGMMGPCGISSHLLDQGAKEMMGPRCITISYWSHY